jgi:hypothetical protein
MVSVGSFFEHVGDDGVVTVLARSRLQQWSTMWRRCNRDPARAW